MSRETTESEKRLLQLVHEPIPESLAATVLGILRSLLSDEQKVKAIRNSARLKNDGRFNNRSFGGGLLDHDGD